MNMNGIPAIDIHSHFDRGVKREMPNPISPVTETNNPYP